MGEIKNSPIFLLRNYFLHNLEPEQLMFLVFTGAPSIATIKTLSKKIKARVSKMLRLGNFDCQFVEFAHCRWNQRKLWYRSNAAQEMRI